jgi:hypothetical protein
LTVGSKRINSKTTGKTTCGNGGIGRRARLRA